MPTPVTAAAEDGPARRSNETPSRTAPAALADLSAAHPAHNRLPRVGRNLP